MSSTCDVKLIFGISSLVTNIINAFIDGYIAFAFGKMGSQEKIDNLGKIIDAQNLSLVEYDNREKSYNERRSTITERENKLIDEVRFLDRKLIKCEREVDHCRHEIEKTIFPLRYSMFHTYCERLKKAEDVDIRNESLKP